MSRSSKWISPVIALALVIGLFAASVTAEDKAAGKGTVAGKVVDKDGQPVADAKVRLMNPMERKKAPAAQSQAADPAAPDKDAAKKDKPTPIAEATTDSE